MKYREITQAVDHALLHPTATWQEVRKALDDGVKYQVASVYLPPAYIARAKDYVGDAVELGTVVGFPNGYTSTAAKICEIGQAVEAGAGELDAVISLGWLKDGRYDEIFAELSALRQAANGRILKIIVETFFLSDREKIKMCELVTKAGADYIRTSTGFAAGGANAKDLLLFTQYLGPDVGIKAAGGIATLDDAQRFLEIGASRLGTSRIVDILNNLEADGY